MINMRFIKAPGGEWASSTFRASPGHITSSCILFKICSMLYCIKSFSSSLSRGQECQKERSVPSTHFRNILSYVVDISFKKPPVSYHFWRPSHIFLEGYSFRGVNPTNTFIKLLFFHFSFIIRHLKLGRIFRGLNVVSRGK